MVPKNEDRIKAISLRKKGMTYSEILSVVPVAKSTLSLWLRDVGLARRQKQRLTEKKKEAQLRGARAKREIRIQRQQHLESSASKEIGQINRRDLWLVGVALYWSEGSKEKWHRPGSGVQFGNSDPRMVRLFLTWLVEICKVDLNRIWFEVYLHESHRQRTREVVAYWSRALSVPENAFGRVYYKKGNPKTKRRNSTNESYFGLVRVRVRGSSALLRKITGWTDGVVENTK